MPRIDPLPVQQVQPRPVGTPFSSSGGSGIARSGLILAQGLGQIGQVFARKAAEEKNKNNEARVNAARVETFAGRKDIDAQMKSRTGLDAAGAGLDAVTAYNDLQSKIMEGLKDEEQRQLYRDSMISHNATYGFNTADYEEGQVRTGRESVLNDNMSQIAEDALGQVEGGWTERDAKRFGAQLDEGADRLMRFFHLENGEGPLNADAQARMDGALADWRSNVISGAVESLIGSNRADQAQEMRDDLNDELKPSARAKLDKLLAPATVEQAAVKWTAEKFDKHEDNFDFEMGQKIPAEMITALMSDLEATASEPGYAQRQRHVDAFISRRARSWNAMRGNVYQELQDQVENLETEWGDIDKVKLDMLEEPEERALRSWYDGLRGGGKQVTPLEGWRAYNDLFGGKGPEERALVPQEAMLQLAGVMATDDFKWAIKKWGDSRQTGPVKPGSFKSAWFKDAWDVEMEDLYEGKMDPEQLYPAQYQAERRIMEMVEESRGTATRDDYRKEIRELLRPAFVDGNKVGPVAATMDPRFVEREELETAEFTVDPETIPSAMVPVLNSYARTQAENPDSYEPTEDDRGRVYYRWISGDAGVNQYLYNRGFTRDVAAQSSQLTQRPKKVRATRPTMNYPVLRKQAVAALEQNGYEVTDGTTRWAMQMIRAQQIAQEQFGGDMDAARRSMKLPPRPETLPQSTQQGQ